MNNFQSQRPFGYKSLKFRRNDTKMIKSFFIVNDFMGVKLNDDEAMISIDHDKYFFKYSCAEAMGRVSVFLTKLIMINKINSLLV